MGRAIVGIARDRAIEGGHGLLQVVPGATGQKCARLEVIVIGGGISRSSWLCRTCPSAQLGLERGRDRAGYLVLHLEHLGSSAIEGLRPDLIATIALDQLGGDTQIFSTLAYAALENMPDLELPADVGLVEIPASKRKCRSAARDF